MESFDPYIYFYLQMTNIYIRNNHNDHEMLHLPMNASCENFDGHLLANPVLRHKAKTALQNRTIAFRSPMLKETAPVIHIHQRELAHVSSKQYGGKGAILVSDAATTCHVMAIRSYKRTAAAIPLVLASMTHIDSDHYDDCIKRMFQEHVTYHHHEQQQQQQHSSSSEAPLEMDIHLVGGYCDKDKTSVKLSKYLLQMIVNISSKFSSTISMNLDTCVVSSLNDASILLNDTNIPSISSSISMTNISPRRPIARGMALDVISGSIELLETIDPSHIGPGYTLRKVRLFSSSSQSNTLLLVHNPFQDELRISPFEWRQKDRQMSLLLELPDHLLLKYTSTSPECEDEDFCNDMRKSLIFMRDVSVESVFGKKGHRKSVIFRFHPDLNSHVSESVDRITSM